mgnify:CR=1 FL=1
MTDDIQVLIEAWGKLKNYIPSKDRLDAAIAYVNLIDEYGAEEPEWQEVFSHSTHLHQAYKEVFGEIEDEDDDSYDNEDDY